MRPIVAVLACAALAGLVVATTAGGQAPAGRTVVLSELAQGRLIKFVDNPPRTRLVDGGPRRLSTGDEVTLLARIADASGARVGRLHLHCAITLPGPGDRIQQMCDGVFRVRDGLITFSTATAPTSGAILAAITGGTGAYDGARGTLSTVGTEEGATHTLTLLP